MKLIDTHCHIHFPDYELDPAEVIKNAQEEGVTTLICVGCTLQDSRLAISMAQKYNHIWATIGLHPHEGSIYVNEGSIYVNDDISLQHFRELALKPKVVAVGETGLDYHYNHSSVKDQKKLLRFQIELAVERNLPLIFHIREAFDDFWQIFDEYKLTKQPIRGVVHSFSASRHQLDQALARNLYIGLNGIMTFTKNPEQLEAAKAIPTNRLLLETDAPFLTPSPFRGKICEPKHLKVTAEFLSQLRNETLQQLSANSTKNAQQLFKVR